ncbi:MAG: CPBP family intramembrane metalloprotease, partial [Candidatus Sericytochromatia bacterium]|nr:CPBP family intramembrane metalloprotease [Candidatus Tanganyikabacteria bacterium]
MTGPQLGPRETRPQPGPRETRLLAAFALAFLLLYAPGMAQVSWGISWPEAPLNTYFLPAEVVGVLIPVLLLAIGQHKPDVLRWRKPPAAAVGWAVVATLGLAGLLTYTQTGWEKLTGIGPPPGLAEILTITGPADLVWLILGAVLLPAIAEESAFRGYLQTTFEQWTWPVAAILASTALFGLFHHDSYGVPTYLAMGVFLGMLSWRTGSIWPGAASHGANNILAVAQFNGIP